MGGAIDIVRKGVEKTKPYEPTIEVDNLEEDMAEELKKIRSLRERLRSKGL